MNGPGLTGGQLVVQGLIGEGVDTVFGISGSHVLPIYDALRDAPQIRHITACHENNAAVMAAAYARFALKPGVTLVTAGPGATNAVTGTAQAYSSGCPVVIITGSVPLRSKKEIFHGVDDPDFLHKIFSPITKLSVRVERPEDMPEILADAFSTALSGRPGPVHIEIDDLTLKAMVESAAPYQPMPRHSPGLDPAIAESILELLRTAKRPVILAGKGVLASSAQEELAQAAEILAAPVIFPYDAIGVMSYHRRWCAGAISTPMGVNPFCVKLMRDSDLLLGIGLRPDAWNLEVILRNAPPKIVFIGFDEEQIRQEGAMVSCVADARLALQEIIRRLAPQSRTADEAFLARIATNKQAMLQAFQSAVEPYREKTPLHFGLALEELSRHLTPDTIVIGDVGSNSVWATAYLARLGPHKFLGPGLWAAMGFAIPAAIGAKVACPEHAVVGITGDGSFLLSSADFATAVQHHLDIVYVVLHDGRHGMVEMLQRRDYGRAYGTEINPPDFVKYAESFGAIGMRVERTSELGETFRRAFRAEGPVLVDVICESGVPYVSPPNR